MIPTALWFPIYFAAYAYTAWYALEILWRIGVWKHNRNMRRKQR